MESFIQNEGEVITIDRNREQLVVHKSVLFIYDQKMKDTVPKFVILKGTTLMIFDVSYKH
jgi:hypothetical protein